MIDIDNLTSGTRLVSDEHNADDFDTDSMTGVGDVLEDLDEIADSFMSELLYRQQKKASHKERLKKLTDEVKPEFGFYAEAFEGQEGKQVISVVDMHGYPVILRESNYGSMYAALAESVLEAVKHSNGDNVYTLHGAVTRWAKGGARDIPDAAAREEVEDILAEVLVRQEELGSKLKTWNASWGEPTAGVVDLSGDFTAVEPLSRKIVAF